jgi:hypothetical protein
MIRLSAQRGRNGRRLVLEIWASHFGLSACDRAGALRVERDGLVFTVDGYEVTRPARGVPCPEDEQEGVPLTVPSNLIRSSPLHTLTVAAFEVDIEDLVDVPSRTRIEVRLLRSTNVFVIERTTTWASLTANNHRNAQVMQSEWSLGCGGPLPDCSQMRVYFYPDDVGYVSAGSVSLGSDDCFIASDRPDARIRLRAFANAQGWPDTEATYGIPSEDQGPHAVLAVVRDRDLPVADPSYPGEGAEGVGHLGDGTPVCLVGMP